MQHCWAALAVVLVAATGHAGNAQPVSDPASAAASPAPAAAPSPVPSISPSLPLSPPSDPTDLGPILLIESISVSGNHTTQARVIRRALPVRIGDIVRAADPRLVGARYKVLALGFFRDVKLELRRGSARGRVVLAVTVEERGTVVLNRLWFGSSDSSPFWLGADLDERNLFGTGLSAGLGAVYAGSEIDGARDQYAAEVRFSNRFVGASRWGVHGALTWVHGSEPYRVAGAATSSAPDDFRAFSYDRRGGRITGTYDLAALSRLAAGARVEIIDAGLPDAPTRTLDDGRVVPIDLTLRDGRSRVVTLSLGFDRDTRPDPVLPHQGQRFAALAEVGARPIGGSYDFATLAVRWERWWPVLGGRHALGLRLGGGAVLGNAPRFDRLHVSDVNRLVTPRALGLVVSTAPPPDLLGTDNEATVYGELGGSAVGEYAWQLFRRRRHIYGGDLFVGAGVWGLVAKEDPERDRRSGWDALPIDVVVDGGLRLDTELGVFEFTVANALGRVPL